MRVYFILFLAGILSCNNRGEEKRTLIYEQCGVKIFRVCDTTTIFANQAPGCEHEIEGTVNEETDNDKIKCYSQFKFLPNHIVFYKSYRYGVTSGWYKIKNGNLIDLKKELKTRLENSNNLVYRNGMFLYGDKMDSIVFDYGEIINVETPELTGGFSIFKLHDDKMLEHSKSIDFDLKDEDGIYFVTLPGFIPHYQIDINCSTVKSDI